MKPKEDQANGIVVPGRTRASESRRVLFPLLLLLVSLTHSSHAFAVVSPHGRSGSNEGLAFVSRYQIHFFACQPRRMAKTSANEKKQGSASADKAIYTWDEMYLKLKKYYDEYGHSLAQDDPQLMKWIRRIRNEHRWQVEGGDSNSSGTPRNKLSEEKLSALAAIEFAWRDPSSSSRMTWDDTYPKLQEYHAMNGHSLAEDDPQLMKWIKNIRRTYRWQVKGGNPYFPNGKRRSKLSKEKLAALSAIDFAWGDPSSSNAMVWDVMYPKLQEYHATNGHSLADDDPQLMKWIKRIRDRYRWQVEGGDPYFSSGRRQIELNEAKLAALEAIDFPWRDPIASSISKMPWDVMYTKLKEYHAMNGHSLAKDEPQLMKWIRHIRNRHLWQVEGGDPHFSSGRRRETLSKEKLAALKSIDFPWRDPVAYNKFTWEVMFPRLREYYDKHGHSNVALDHDEELCKWAIKIRSFHRYQIEGGSPFYPNGQPRKKLRRDKLEALKSVEFPWELQTVPISYEVMIARMREFHEEHGHLRPAKKDDSQMHDWIARFRSRYRHQVDGSSSTYSSGRERLTISKTKIDEMDEIEFPWFTYSHKLSWIAAMSRLNGFHTTHGHCDVPLDYADKELASWVSMIRHVYRHQADARVDSYFSSGNPRPKLEATQLKELREIEFDWKDPIKSKFEIMVDALRAFRDDHGHSYVSKDDDELLHLWIKKIRSDHCHQVDGSESTFPLSGKKRPKLDNDELQTLNDVHFPWKKDDETWCTVLARLRAFCDEHGSLDFDVILDRGDEDLSNWVSMTRALYSHQGVGAEGETMLGSPRPMLPVEKLEELQQLDFPWAKDA